MTEATLHQVKLTGEEWNSIEIMETDEEMYILKLIIDGFHDVNKVFNRSLSLMSRMKITNTPEMEDYLFNEYFKKRAERVLDLLQSHHEHPPIRNPSKIPKDDEKGRFDENPEYEYVVWRFG